MSLDHRILRRGAASLAGLVLLAGAAHAALDSPSTADGSPPAAAAPGADDKSSKTIELLLQMQDGASAPSSGRGSEMSSTRIGPRGTGATAARNSADTDGQGPTLGDPPAGESPGAASLRSEGAGDTGGIVRRVEAPMVQNLPIGDSDAVVQPSKALRFFRENRALAIGAAVALLVVVAVIGARGGRKG